MCIRDSHKRKRRLLAGAVFPFTGRQILGLRVGAKPLEAVSEGREQSGAENRQGARLGHVVAAATAGIAAEVDRPAPCQGFQRGVEFRADVNHVGFTARGADFLTQRCGDVAAVHRRHVTGYLER